MSEGIIKFETAKLAKKKGFDLQYPAYYRSTEKGTTLHDFRSTSILTSSFSDIREASKLYQKHYFTAPTQSELQKWLRNIHGIHIEILLSDDSPYNTFYYREMKIGQYFSLSHSKSFNTYEEALEEALITVLQRIPNTQEQKGE